MQGFMGKGSKESHNDHTEKQLSPFSRQRYTELRTALFDPICDHSCCELTCKQTGQRELGALTQAGHMWSHGPVSRAGSLCP